MDRLLQAQWGDPGVVASAGQYPQPPYLLLEDHQEPHRSFAVEVSPTTDDNDYLPVVPDPNSVDHNSSVGVHLPGNGGPVALKYQVTVNPTMAVSAKSKHTFPHHALDVSSRESYACPVRRGDRRRWSQRLVVQRSSWGVLVLE